MLTARELAGIRETVADSISPSLGTIYSSGGTTDPQGGTEQAFTAVGTVLCRVIPSRGAIEVGAGEAIRSVPGFNIYVPYSATVLPTYRFQSNGQTFEVVGTNKGQSEAADLRLTAFIIQ